MNKNLLRSILLIITYSVVLVLVLVKIDLIWAVAAQILGALKPLFLGFAIAFVLNRPCTFFFRLYHGGLAGRKLDRFSRPLAVLSAYVALVVVVTALFSFVLPQVADSIRLFVSSLSGYMANLQALADEVFALFDREGVDFSSLNEYLRRVLEGVLNTATNAASHVLVITSGVISMGVTLVLAIVFSVYMLSGREKLLSQCRRVMRAYLPGSWADRVQSVVQLSADTFTNFVSGQLTEACILGVLCALGMLFIQSDYAALVGVIVGTTALIPVMGAYIGAVLPAFLLLMEDPWRALAFLVFLGILQQIEGNVIYPRVVGTSIGLPGIWVLAAVTVGGGLFGLLGVLLSVPAASVLYTLLKRDVHRRLEEKMPAPEQAEEGTE